MQLEDKLFIAGHTGLIGSEITKSFLRRGYKNLLLATHENLELTNLVSVNNFFDSQLPQYVILAAGKVGGIIENQKYPADFMATNLAIQMNVLSAAHRTGVKKLTYFGSSCMYPRECVQPMAETALLSGYPEPTSLAYALSKLAGLQMCLSYNQQYGEPKFIPVIPNSVYGQKDNFNPNTGHVLSSLIYKFHNAKKLNASEMTLWGSGAPRREFIHATDIANACVMLLSKDVSSLKFPLNLGSGSDISIRELAEKIAKIVGYEGSIKWDTSKPDGAPRKLLDSTNMNSFGWRTEMDLDSGIKDTYEWFLCNESKMEINL